MTPPFVSFLAAAASGLSSTEQALIENKPCAVIVDGLLCTNTSGLTLSVFAVAEIQMASPVTVFIAYNVVLNAGETKDLLDGRCLYLAKGNALRVYSDDSTHTFDACANYRQLLESEG